MASVVPTPDRERIEQAVSFVKGMLAREAAYHQHKETAAYAAVTLFAGIAGTAAVSGAWPPEWGRFSTALSITAATLLWTAVLIFLRFQLTRRRWAALRVAACDRLLAAWLQEPPSEEEISRPPSTKNPHVSLYDEIANWIWGSKAAVRAVDRTQTVYPRALVNELIAQESRGTDALKHEWLILLSGWAFYVILVATALLRERPDVAV